MDFNSVHAVVGELKDYGVMAPIIAFLFFFVQAIIPIFPYFILAGASGILFGFAVGTALAWSGALAGACFAFLLVRMTGWDWLHKHLYRRYNLDVKELSPRFSFWAIVALRVFPVMPTPVINVVAGISGISFWVFLGASAIGKIPAAVIYTGLGNRLYMRGDWPFVIIVLGAFLAITLAGVKIIRRRGYI